MERDDSARVTAPGSHLPAFYSPVQAAAGTRLELSREAAHHARVLRLAAGDLVGITDGLGTWATASVGALERDSLSVVMESVTARPRPQPVHLYVPVADKDRMLWLAEKATEIGVSSWTAVRFRRSSSVAARGEGEAFRAKLRSRMIAALEQSNGAWLPRLEGDTSVADLAARPAGKRIVLDARGESLVVVAGSGASPDRHVLAGPEGGIEPDEMERLVAGGWERARLGDTTLRFETAALAAVAILQIGCATPAA